MSAANLPTGTVTFLFTDIEGSTQLWERHPDQAGPALARHDQIIEEIVDRHGGKLVRPRGEGDSRFAVFARATDAVAAAAVMQQLLHAEPWGTATPLRIRVALHTGEADLREGDYYGSAVNRCARLRGAAHGGQTLVSAATQELAQDHLPEGVTLHDLGEHHLKDLQRPEHIFQLVVPSLPSDFPPLRTLDSFPNNLPQQPTPFIGREKEVAAIADLLERDNSRLVTITGPGGMGKTRLALQVAADLTEGFAAGVFFVELVSISDPDLLVPAIAQVVGLRESGNRSAFESLKEYLRNKRMLLVLDNFEQMVDAAPLVSELLSSAPLLKVLVTSRSVLHLRGEKEFAVPPLSLPDPKRLPTIRQLTYYEAVRLFIERASEANPKFQVTNDNAPAIAEICFRLDGLPLAIELAAARVRILPPQAMLARLESTLKLLTGGARDLPARQQTLRATIEWSYDLLNPEERKLFDMLSVFAGGCTLDAAEKVCNTGEEAGLDTLEGLSSLLAKSLLRPELGAAQEPERWEEPRFSMLKTVREYGLERLHESGHEEAVHRRHAEYYLAIAEEGEQPRYRPNPEIWLERLDVEHDNMRAVLAWSLESAVDIALRLCGALQHFWLTRGHFDEGRAWAERATGLSGAAENRAYPQVVLNLANIAFIQGDLTLARPLFERLVPLLRESGDRQLLAHGLTGLGLLVTMQDGPEAGRSLSEEGVSIFRVVGDEYGLAQALVNLGSVALFLDDYSQARALLEEGLALLRGTNDHYATRALGALGNLARIEGDYARAKTLYEECLLLIHKLDTKWEIPSMLHNLGHVAISQGELTGARELFRESLALHVELGDKPGIAEGLYGFAGIAAAQAEPERAARLFGASDVLRESTGAPMWPADRVDYKRNLTLARAQMDEVNFEAALVEGRTMSMEQAIAYALEERADA